MHWETSFGFMDVVTLLFLLFSFINANFIAFSYIYIFPEFFPSIHYIFTHFYSHSHWTLQRLIHIQPLTAGKLQSLLNAVLLNAALFVLNSVDWPININIFLINGRRVGFMFYLAWVRSIQCDRSLFDGTMGHIHICI